MDGKRLLRTRVLAARAARPPEVRARAGASLAAHGVAVTAGASVVAAYAAVAGEPPTAPLLAALRRRGVEVVLPVVVGDALGWGRFVSWSALVAGPHGLLQPAAADARVAPELALVPALAVDRDGHRLGRGGGFYDRWLALARPPRVIAVVYDDEVVDEVPVEGHDIGVDAALTPGRGLIVLGQRDDVVAVGDGDGDGDAPGFDALPNPGAPGS